MQTQTLRQIALTTLLFIALSILNGCAYDKIKYEKIKPWHRDLLAKDMAQLVPDELENESDEHIYFSKEAAKGGQGVGGGGCGCN